MAAFYSDDPEQMREMLTWPDETLGKFLLGRFIQITAERHGVAASHVESAGNVIVDALRNVESLDVEDIPIEKSLRLAALGEFAASGRIFRRRLINGGISKINEGLAVIGRKFIAGRKPGTGGPIRKAIAKLLAKNSEMKNPELWTTLKGKPPKGWQFFDNSAGKYIEGPGMANMNYERFCNVCGYERKKVRPTITG